MKRRLTWLAFCGYAALMIWLLFGQRMGLDTAVGEPWQNLNLKPLDTVRRYLWVLEYSQNPYQIHAATVNLAGNVVLFVPLGCFLPVLWKKQECFGWFLLTVAALVVCVELLQLVTMLGSCDVDDLLLNLVGASIGFLVWKLCKKTKPS